MNKLISIAIVLLVATNIYSQAPCPGMPTVIYEGRTYNTVKIKKQCWLKENLNVGMMIPWREKSKNNNVIEKYCYNDSIANCDKYGGLYQWAEAVQYKNGADNTTTANPKMKGKVQGICPLGWHLPNKEESYTLGNSVNRDGNALKAIGQETGIFAGTNTSSFSALIYKYSRTDADHAFFWLSDEQSYQGDLATDFFIYGKSFVSQQTDYKYQRMSVRCIKD